MTKAILTDSNSFEASTFAFPNGMPTGVLVDGKWRLPSHGAELAVVNPATEETFASVASATIADVDDALDAAQRGWFTWRSVNSWSRSEILRKVAINVRQSVDEIALTLTMEQGKPIHEALAEVLAAADQFDWYADESRRIYGRVVDGHSQGQRLMVRRESIGPVLAISTWNFPALLPARKIAPALAAGCSVIVISADETPLTAGYLVRACLEAGVHPAAIGLLTGNPEMVSERLIRSTIIRKISLTGSAAVGRILLREAAERIIPTTMELGGHAPVLVFPDADIEHAVTSCVNAKYRNAGQVCTSPSRFFVHQRVIAEFTERFAEATGALRVGDGRNPETDVGPLTSERRRTATDRLVKDAVSRGARILCGGRRDTNFERGFYYQPTVLVGVNSDMQIMREEPFAPVAPISGFSDTDDVISQANSTSFGLASYVFSKDLENALRVSDQLEAGMVGINTLLIACAEMPFGGVKASGYGREGGTEGIDDYCVEKSITIAL